jgi:hypothetical protein
MSNKMTNVIMFVAGAAIGSLATWKVMQMRYEKRIQEEVDSVKETFARWNNRDSGEEIAEVCEETEEYSCDSDGTEQDEQDKMMDMYEYEANIQRLKYVSASNAKEEGGGEPAERAPYVISPDMFGENGYECTWLTYYADGVVEDDHWIVVENVDDVIGDDFMNHFDEYAENTVFIRNESLKTDYEITKDRRTYAESQEDAPVR